MLKRVFKQQGNFVRGIIIQQTIQKKKIHFPAEEESDIKNSQSPNKRARSPLRGCAVKFRSTREISFVTVYASHLPNGYFKLHKMERGINTFLQTKLKTTNLDIGK